MGAKADAMRWGMRSLSLGITCSVLLWPLNGWPQTPGTLTAEMTRLGVNLAVVVPTQSIDDHPLWSPDSRFLFANLPRGWWKVDLSSIVLTAAVYRGQKIGALAKGSTVTQAGSDEIAQAKGVSPEVKGSLRLNDGTQLSWEPKGSFGSTLSIQSPGRPPESAWETDAAACGYLILSPDKKYIATYCEQTGVIVFQIKSGP